MSLISRVPMRSVTSFVRQFSVSCRSLKSEAGEGGCGVSSKQAEILKQKTPVGKSELSSVEIILSPLQANWRSSPTFTLLRKRILCQSILEESTPRQVKLVVPRVLNQQDTETGSAREESQISS